jgi:hypothetical protein
MRPMDYQNNRTAKMKPTPMHCNGKVELMKDPHYRKSEVEAFIHEQVEKLKIQLFDHPAWVDQNGIYRKALEDLETALALKD